MIERPRGSDIHDQHKGQAQTPGPDGVRLELRQDARYPIRIKRVSIRLPRSTGSKPDGQP